jgi:hypothetical protein
VTVDKTAKAGPPRTLMQAHDALVRIRPKKTHHKQHGLRITSGRQRYTLSWPRSIGVTITSACTGLNENEKKPKKFRRRFTRKYANGNTNLATCCPGVEVIAIRKSGAGSHSPKD